MYLPELVLIALNLVLAGLNVNLGFRCYEKYVVLPRLRAERAHFLEFAFYRVAGLHRKRIKAVNDKLSKTKAKAQRSNIVKIGRRVLAGKKPFERRAA